MLKQKEIIAIIAITIVIAFSINLLTSLTAFLYTVLVVFLIIMINVIAKKITSYSLDSEIEVKMWEIKRWGVKIHRYFKKPFPIGAFLPLLTTAMTFGIFVWMGSLVFDVKAKVHRAARRYGIYSFSEMTEWHIALIAAAGIFANLVFSVIGYLIGFPLFARLNIYYAFYNLLPIGSLDGNKLFFGSLPLWSFLAVLVLIALGYAFLLV